MTLVVDEYDDTDGFVTNRAGRQQHRERELMRTKSTSLSIRSLISWPSHARLFEEFERHFGIKLISEGEETDVDTIHHWWPLIFSMLGRVPARSELIRHPTSIELKVLDADPRRVKKLKIHPLCPPAINTKLLPEEPKVCWSSPL